MEWIVLVACVLLAFVAGWYLGSRRYVKSVTTLTVDAAADKLRAGDVVIIPGDPRPYIVRENRPADSTVTVWAIG